MNSSMSALLIGLRGLFQPLQPIRVQPRTHLHGLVEALRAHYADAEIAIKAHPRSACLDEYRQRYPQLFHIDNTIGTEVFTPLLNDHCTIVGDISSTLFTARWLKPQARIVAVQLKALQGNALNDNLIKLFEQLQIPLIEQRDIAATLQP